MKNPPATSWEALATAYEAEIVLSQISSSKRQSQQASVPTVSSAGAGRRLLLLFKSSVMCHRGAQSMNVLRHLLRTMAVLVLCQQLFAIPTMAGDDCLNISRNDDLIILSGTLQEVTAATADFDPESFYILQLESEICASGEEFSDPESRFREIQIYSSDENVQTNLENLIGKRVEIRGVGFGAHTRHHYRPLVVDVSTISPV